MKIAILGTRGVPPAYGGFETLAAELGTRLVQRGHDVTVYCRSQVVSATWNGIHRIVLPAIRSKYFETVSHTALSALDALRRDFDVVLLCNAANAFTILLLRAARLPVVINVDGIERRRRKWNILGRAVYLAGEALSASFADRVIADANVIAIYYREQFGIEPATIPYGSDFPDEPDTDVLQRLNVEPHNYLLYVSRFEPENNPLEVVNAYEKVADTPPLVMVGDALYAKNLLKKLHSRKSAHVLFPGAIYGADYRTLQRHALIYIQATEVGGTHPALIEAMGSGGCVLALETPENREVGGDSIGYFGFHPQETLSQAIRQLLADADLRDELRRRARKRAADRYSWAVVTEAYEHLLEQVAERQ
ncbi:MAG TPA: glycosyltransferase [Thermoanaerobaculia bacterium]|nr:glycosyltransferase [Thermoanaerobaculia bacterium]